MSDAPLSSRCATAQVASDLSSTFAGFLTHDRRSAMSVGHPLTDRMIGIIVDGQFPSEIGSAFHDISGIKH